MSRSRLHHIHLLPHRRLPTDDDRTARLFDPPLPTTAVPMRTPCYACGHPDGTVARKSQQAVVTCAQCGRYAYCAPKRDLLRWWGQVR
jgi:hypothetical protein